MTRSAVLERPPTEAFELSESVTVALEEAATYLPEDKFKPLPGSIFDEQGRVPLIIIRPGIGKGRGRHLYEADMLRENAHKFSGWKMFIDHLSPEARRAAGGLPRSVRDLGGRIDESWWQEDIPTDNGIGATVGLAKPVPFVRELLENDPEIIESSISAQATAVRPVTRDGQRVWLVEGIDDNGSVDWVTEAGAGGRVIDVMEAAYQTPEAVDMALLESLGDDELRTHLEENRPDLLEAMKGKTPEPSEPEGGDVADITPEVLQEALASSPDVLTEALQQSSEIQLFVNGLVEAKLEEEREATDAQAEAKVNRIIQLHELKDSAHKQIAESGLPESWQEGLRERFSLQEGKPTDALDVLDEVDENGEVTKPAADTLREAVEQDVKAERKRLAEANPTRVRGQTPTTEDGEQPKYDAKKTGWGRFLQESAGVDPNGAYGHTLEEPAAKSD